MTISPGSKRVTLPPTWHAVIFGGVLVGLLALLVIARDALAPYIVGLVLVFVANGLVDRLERAGVPRWGGTLIAIAVLIGGLGLFVYLILDVLVEQVASLVTSLPEIREAVIGWLVGLKLPQNVYDALTEWVEGLTTSVPRLLPGIFGALLSGVAGVVALLVALAGLPFWIFYTLSDSPKLQDGLRQAVPPDYRDLVADILGIVAEVFGAWARGLVILSLAMGIPFFIGFSIFGLVIDPDIGRYALLFAVALGLAEFVPIVGPIIVIVPILAITGVVAGLTGVIAVGILFVILEQIDGAILIPRVQGNALNLHPAIILPALVVGSALAGLLGAILALPVTAALRRVAAHLIAITATEPAPQTQSG